MLKGKRSQLHPNTAQENTSLFVFLYWNSAPFIAEAIQTAVPFILNAPCFWGNHLDLVAEPLNRVCLTSQIEMKIQPGDQWELFCWFWAIEINFLIILFFILQPGSLPAGTEEKFKKAIYKSQPKPQILLCNIISPWSLFFPLTRLYCCQFHYSKICESHFDL